MGIVADKLSRTVLASASLFIHVSAHIDGNTEWRAQAAATLVLHQSASIRSSYIS